MAKQVKGGTKEMRELQRRLRHIGIEFYPDGKAKIQLWRNGFPIRYRDGRIVTLPNSPGPHSVNTLKHRLEGLGLLVKGAGE